jgi:hypothetical protein
MPVAAAMMPLMAALVTVALEIAASPASVPTPSFEAVATAPTAIVGQDNAARRCGHT